MRFLKLQSHFTKFCKWYFILWNW